jgi:hypothetical protein
MTRVRFGAGVALVVGVAAVAAAQPPLPGGRPPVKFKQFGSTPEQFYQSSVSRWTGQLVLDLEAIKADVALAKLTPAGRAAITAQAENALLHTLALDQLTRRGGNRDRLHAAFANVDKALAGLAATVNQQPGARQAVAGSFARADASYQQLAAAIGNGDNDPDRSKRRLVRLAESIDDNAEELRRLAADQVNLRDLDRAVGLYAREARLLARRVRDGEQQDLVNRTYAAMVDRWSESVTLMGRVRGLPAAVQNQAGRVDTLHRRMGVLLNLSPSPPPPPPGPGVPPPPEVNRFAFAVGADAGAQPRVTVFATEKGDVAHNFFAYDQNFPGGVRVDMADLNGDGVPDLVTAPGPAKTTAVLPVRVFDGRDMNLLVEFVPFQNWTGGLHVAAANLTRDGRAAIAVNAEGTQHVKVFDLAQGKEIDSFFVHDQKATGGVRMAWGDVNGDGVPDLLTANGPGNIVTTVKIFSGKNREVLAEFPAADNRYRGGAFIAAGDVTGDRVANPVVGLDGGTVPLVRVFDGRGKPLVEWLAYDERFRGGVRVAITGRNHVVVAPGFGMKNSPVRVFHTGNVKRPVSEFAPFPGFDGGLFIGGR